MIDIKGIDKADVLRTLYDHATVQGMGFLHAQAGRMSREEAQAILDEGHTYFDYLKGRVMKVDLSKDTLDPRLYDRDNGEGAAERAILNLIEDRVDEEYLENKFADDFIVAIGRCLR